MTKAFFKENNVVYEEKDVSVDAAARDEMVAGSIPAAGAYVIL